MTYQTIDPARITWLRKAKKAMLDIAKSDYAKDNLRFVSRAKQFAEKIPHRTNDYFAWSAYSPDGFTIMADELTAEYEYLNEWSNKLFDKWQSETIGDLKKETEIAPANDLGEKKTTEIKPEENSKMRNKKKTTEIKGEQLAISIRGGARPGAGRKSIGVKKAVSIALPEEAWQEIDSLIQSGEYASYADFFRRKAGWS